MPERSLTSVLNKLERILKGRVVMLGIGNLFRGDDGFGAILARRIRERVGFKVFVGESAPENFLGKLIKEKPDTVLVIDAMDFGGSIGEFRLFDSGAVKAENFFVTHNIALDLIFTFLKEHLRGEVYLLAIQPKEIGFKEGLSQEIKPQLDKLANWFLERYGAYS